MRSGRVDACVGADLNRGRGLGAPPLEPDLHMTVVDVQVGQIIALHQADEVVDFLNVQLITGIAGFLCHAFTPLHGNRLSVRHGLSGASIRWFILVQSIDGQFGSSCQAGRGQALIAVSVQEPARSLSKTNRVQGPGQVGQDLAAVGGHQDIVLDADTAPIGKVDPRLDGHDHARLQDGLGLLAEPGRLVNLHAQAVADAVVKKTAETRLLDDGAGFGIDIMGSHARANRRDRSLLSQQDGPVDRFKFRSDLTGHHNASQVTFVGSAGRSPVQEYEIVIADPRCLGRPRMRQSGPRLPRRRSAESWSRSHRSVSGSPPAGRRFLSRSRPPATRAEATGNAFSAKAIASRIASISSSSLI